MLIKYNQIIVSKVIKPVIDCVFPKHCASCLEYLNNYENIICLKCNHQLPLANSIEENINSLELAEGKIVLSSFLFKYNKKGNIKNLIHEFKYHKHIELGKLFAQWQKTSLFKIINVKKVDYVVSVPMHKKKKRKRGYNQVDAYAQEIAKIIEAEFIEDLLVKIVNTKTQSKQNKKERLLNIKDSFKINPYSVNLNGKHLLIVDDLVTTGATLLSIYNLINTTYHCKISVAAVAITHLE